MTRREFLEDILDFDDLKRFCDYNRLDHCDNVMDSEYFNDYIMGRIQDPGYFASWIDIYKFLDELPGDAKYYIENDYGEIFEADEDAFQEYKGVVLDRMDQDDAWDPEEDEDEDVDDEEVPFQEVIPDEERISEEEFCAMIGMAS